MDDGPDATAELLAPVADVYAKRLRRCGPSPKGVFWRHHFGQVLRFELLLGVIPPAEAAAGGLVLNDLGCGYGAFFDVLGERPEIAGGRYFGYDICPAMVEASRGRVRDPRASFELSASALHEADYSFVSGTYNMKLDADEAAWLAYVKDSLRDLWAHSRRGLAFNMLDIGNRIEGDGLYYARAEEFANFCRSALSPDTRLISSSPLKEWTVYVRR